MGSESGDFNGLGWSCGLWLRWIDLGDLGWGCGLRSDHGSCLRLGFDLDWGSGLSFNGLISVRGESQWLCCVCGCRWEVEEAGWWWLDCGFYFCFVCLFCVLCFVCVCVCVWWLLVEKWRKRKAVGAWNFFFFCYRGLWLSLMGQQWKWYCCCIMMIWFLWLMFISILMSYLYYFKWVAKIINFLL